MTEITLDRSYARRTDQENFAPFRGMTHPADHWFIARARSDPRTTRIQAVSLHEPKWVCPRSLTGTPTNVLEFGGFGRSPETTPRASAVFVQTAHGTSNWTFPNRCCANRPDAGSGHVRLVGGDGDQKMPNLVIFMRAPECTRRSSRCCTRVDAALRPVRRVMWMNVKWRECYRRQRPRELHRQAGWLKPPRDNGTLSLYRWSLLHSLGIRRLFPGRVSREPCGI
jgi:hypothetical protein